MAKNLTPQPDIELVRDLLSPYLDDEVTDEERALVDAALTDSPELRDELESLRQTVALVADLPRVSAPRPFTLTEADVQAVAPKPKKSFGLPAWFGGFAAAAALLVCVLAVGGLFLTSQLGSGGMAGDVAMAPQQQAAEQAPAEEPAAAAPTEAPAAEEPAPAEEEAPMAEQAAEEEAPAEEAPAEAAATELLAERKEEETAKAVIVEEEVEEATNLAPPPVAATDTTSLSDVDEVGSAAEGALESQSLPAATRSPLGTATPAATPTPVPVVQAAPGEAGNTASEGEESAMAEGEAGTAATTGEVISEEQDDSAQRGEGPQPTATAIALLTLQPPEPLKTTPTPVETVPEGQPETPYRTAVAVGIVLVLVIIIVITIGLIVSWARKQD